MPYGGLLKYRGNDVRSQLRARGGRAPTTRKDVGHMQTEEYSAEEPCELIRNMQAMFPDSSLDDMFPEGITESQKPRWHQAVLRGMERRDPTAPRFPKILLETQARAQGLSTHRWEFQLYGPLDVPYHWNRSVEDAWELHAHFKRQITDQEAVNTRAAGEAL